ncbi:MAG: sulfite exporter TauE/SafE family protein [Aureliella sp.]
MLDWYWYVLLILAGFLAGIINTIAGGGSFLTLPALMFICGLDPQIANGTNRIAILFSSGAASFTFHGHGLLDKKLALQLTLPTLTGVPLGALGAVYLPATAFKPVFGAIFILMAIVIGANPKRLLESNVQQNVAPSLCWLVFFSIGIYVGFIQAGMGILLLLGMSMLQTGDLVASNGVKNLIGFLVTLVAASVFLASGLVQWAPGLITALGNVAGGFVGAKLAIDKGNKLVFSLLIAVMIATGIKLILF